MVTILVFSALGIIKEISQIVQQVSQWCRIMFIVT